MKQKRKVTPLTTAPYSDNDMISRMLIIIGSLFCLGAMTLFFANVNAAPSPKNTSFVYSGVDDKNEVLYKAEFVYGNNDFLGEDILSEIYTKNSDLYIISSKNYYPMVVKREGNSNQVSNGVYSNILGGYGNIIKSDNITIIGGQDNKVYAGNNDAVMLGGESNTLGTGDGEGKPGVLLGGSENKIESSLGNMIIGGDKNGITGSASNGIILGGINNKIQGKNAIVGGSNVNVESGINNVFVFSDSNKSFEPKSSNAFYLNLSKGVGLNMNAQKNGNNALKPGVYSSGAVSFGNVNIGGANCDGYEIGTVIGDGDGCLRGCVLSGGIATWSSIVNSEKCGWNKDEPIVFTGGKCIDIPSYARRCVEGTRNPENTLSQVIESYLFENCNSTDGYDNKKQKTSDISSDYECKYVCEEGYFFYNGKCYKDCEITWADTNQKEIVHYGQSITGYRDIECKENVECDYQIRTCTSDNDSQTNTKLSGSDVYKYKSCKFHDNSCNGNGKYDQQTADYIGSHGTCTFNCTERKVNNNPYSCKMGNSRYNCECEERYHSEGESPMTCEPNQCNEDSLDAIEGAMQYNNGYLPLDNPGTYKLLSDLEASISTDGCIAVCDDKHYYNNGVCVPKEYTCTALGENMERYGNSDKNIPEEYEDQLNLYDLADAAQAVSEGKYCVATCIQPNYESVDGQCVLREHICTPEDEDPENAYYYHNPNAQEMTEDQDKKIFVSETEAGTYPCAYLCKNQYQATWDETTGKYKCEIHEPGCIGHIPDKADLVEGSDEGLTSDVERKLYKNSAVAYGKKCAYVCKPGLYRIKIGEGYICGECEDEYDPETETCIIDIDSVSCEGYPKRIWGGNSCLDIGYCTINGHKSTSVPTGGKLLNYADAQPIGIPQTKWNWKCVTGTPNKNVCEYKCAENYNCSEMGVCQKYSCPKLERATLYPGARASYEFEINVLTGVIGKGGGSIWKYVDNLNSTTLAEGCYFQCNTGSFYGIWKYSSDERYWATGCLKRECPDFPDYLKGVKNNITTVKHPRWHENYNEQGNLVTGSDSDYWKYDETPGEKPGCYYSCTGGAQPTMINVNGVDVVTCLKECPAISESTLYPGARATYEFETKDLITKKIGDNGYTDWKYTDNVDSPTLTEGCYFQCGTGSFYGVWKYSSNERYWATGCLKRECPDLPVSLAAMKVSGLLRTVSNPRWHENYNEQGDRIGIGNDSDWWRYDENPGEKPGCYYECTEAATHTVRVRTEHGYMTGCSADVCPLPVKSNLYPDANSSTIGELTGSVIIRMDPDTPEDRNKWEYVDNVNTPSLPGCYFQCNTGSFYGVWKGGFSNSKYRSTGCLERICPDFPDYLRGIEKFIIKTYNPRWHKNYNEQGNFVDGSNSDYWKYDENPGGKSGCYFSCNTGMNYYHVPDEQGRDTCDFFPGGDPTWCDTHPCEPGGGTTNNDVECEGDDGYELINGECEPICRPPRCTNCGWYSDLMGCRPNEVNVGLQDCSAFESDMPGIKFVEDKNGKKECILCVNGEWDDTDKICK